MYAFALAMATLCKAEEEIAMWSSPREIAIDEVAAFLGGGIQTDLVVEAVERTLDHLAEPDGDMLRAGDIELAEAGVDLSPAQRQALAARVWYAMLDRARS